jgi:hypothetical protein
MRARDCGDPDLRTPGGASFASTFSTAGSVCDAQSQAEQRDDRPSASSHQIVAQVAEVEHNSEETTAR